MSVPFLVHFCTELLCLNFLCTFCTVFQGVVRGFLCLTIILNVLLIVVIVVVVVVV